MPSFPFYYWLPEVHSESNSSLSLLLAGLVLKLSIYGLTRFMLSSFYLCFQFLAAAVLSLTVLGAVVITCSCFRFFDLKKLIAFSSILHLNLALASLFSLNSCGMLSGILMSLSHSLSSVALFLFAGLLINKTYSRYIDSIFMLDLVLRSVLVFFVLANLSLPGSINFCGELLSLTALVSIDAIVVGCFLLLSFLSNLLWFMIVNRKLVQCCSYSLCYPAACMLLWLVFMLYSLGCYFLLAARSSNMIW